MHIIDTTRLVETKKTAFDHENNENYGQTQQTWIWSTA